MLDKIKKVDWTHLVNRKDTLLLQSLSTDANTFFDKLTGIPWKVSFRLHLHGGDVLHSQKELDDLKNIFSRNGVKLLYHFRNLLIFHVKALDELGARLEKLDEKKLTQMQLYLLTHDYLRTAFYAHNFVMPMPVADRALSSLILDALPSDNEKEKQAWLNILIQPIKENEHTKELRSFLNLAAARENNQKIFGGLMEKHLKEFSWVGARNYLWEKAWKKDDIERRLEDFFNSAKNPLDELAHIENLKKETITSTQKLLDSLNIPKRSNLYWLIQLAKEYAYLRTWRSDVMYRAGFRASKIIYQMMEMADVEKSAISVLSYRELLSLAKNRKMSIDSGELEQRKHFFSSAVLDGKYFVLSGKEWREKLESAFKQNLGQQEKTAGNIAYPGKVRGAAKIVLTADDTPKVQRGDILISVMTFPSLIHAMEKAAAFVTDEGGILCHAAVIARELKKPCVIGTKIATKIFHDGDLIEVDADAGVVKKLS